MSDFQSEGSIQVLDRLERDLSEDKAVNTQLWENSPLKGSPVDKAADDLVNGYGLTAVKKPNFAIKNSKAEHQLILLLKLKGLSNREIAKQTNFTEPWVSQICRQPWFQLMLVESLANAQEEIIDQIVRVEATNSIFKLVTLRDNAKSESVQKDCAVEIINRHLGKPIQRTEVMGTVQHSLRRAEDIDKQLAEVEAEEKRLLTDHANGG